MAITIRPMATDIQNFEQLNALTQINNVPIDVIEQRARPGSWSQGGFINQQERLVEVLRNDWTTVASLGLTHSEIGEKLGHIIRTSMRSYGGRGHSGEQNTISIVSDFHQGQNTPLPQVPNAPLSNNTNLFARFCTSVSLRAETVWKTAGIFNKIKAFFSSFALIYQQTFNPQNPITATSHVAWPLRNLAATRIHAECEGSGGHQEDIFKTGERSSLNDGVVVDDEYEWCRNYTFTNLDTGERINVAYGVVEYIKRYGFYKGNVPYRVDPIKLVSVLTGVRVADLQAYARSRSS